MLDEDADALGRLGTRHPLWLAEHIVFLVLVALASIESIEASRHESLIAVGSIALVCWYGFGFLYQRVLMTATSRAVWLFVLTALWVGLLLISPQFSWVAFPLFLLYVLLLPTRVALPSVAVVTAVVVAVQLTTGPDDGMARAFGPVIGAGVAILLGLNLRLLARESARRRRLIDELVRTQEDLVATHDELARVQRETGALGERDRLAREIHDTLAQGLTSILLLLRDARREADELGNPVLTGALVETKRLVRENLEEVRRVVQALSPASLDHTPLSDALGRLADRLGEQTDATVRCTLEGEPIALPTAHEVALLRVAQSALANVRQHAQAHEVAVTLSYLPDAVTLDVVDDGVGFDPDHLDSSSDELERGADGVPHPGFGLRAMRGRLTELGGTLVIESAPGEGTAVAAALPLTVLASPGAAR